MVDAISTGSWAHRVRSLWTNFLPATFLEGCVEFALEPQALQTVFDPFHMPAPVYQDDQPPFTQLNKRGEPRSVLPTLVSYARSHTFKQRKDGKPTAGEVWNCESGRWDEPNIAEREHAMGFVEGDAWARGVSDGVRL